MTTSISVSYKSQEGWHVFQSDQLPGLYVASKNAKRAYDDVAPSIQKLVMLDEGIECQVVPEASYEEFVASMKHAAPVSRHAYPTMMSQRFVLTSAVAA